LAVMTDWGLLGGFGVCLILSGFAEDSLVAGLAGFALLIAAFVAHVVINRIFQAGFSQPQIALGLTSFTVGVLCFIVSVLFNTNFVEADVEIGLLGFTALAASFIVYVIINYGVRESYAMVYRASVRERRGA
jgi:drug/metabolite transporter (DMT)-like permease